MNFKRLALTDIKIDIKRIPKKKTLVAAMEAAGEFIVLNFFESMFIVYPVELIYYVVRCQEQMGEQFLG